MMKSQENTKKKLIKEIDKNITEIETNICSVYNIRTSSEMSSSYQKKINQIVKDMQNLMKLFFDPKNFDEEIFEYFMEKNIIKLLTDYISLQSIVLVNEIYPFLHKILFDSNGILEMIGLNEEVLLMSSSVIASIKILIKTFHCLWDAHPDDPFMENYLIGFIYTLLGRLVIYPNFYNSISSSNNLDDIGKGDENFDSALFELIVQMFSQEFLFQKRESKCKLRKAMLMCLNLEHFYTVNISNIERLLEYLVNNLICYYEDFTYFEAWKYISVKEISNVVKKEKVSNEDLETINTEDTISYLKFFSMLLHCFSTQQLKTFLSNMLFNKFFCEFIQRDIINMNDYTSANQKIRKVLEFLLFITKYVKNYEIAEIFFYFIFGLNSYISNEDDMLMNDDMHSEPDFVVDNNEENDENNCNLLTMDKIKENIDTIINRSNRQFSNLVKLNIEKGSHHFENILAFFTVILESTANIENEIIMLNMLTNMVRNTSTLFMSEILIPYYLSSICKQIPKQFDKMSERLKASRDSIYPNEIISNIQPKNFTISLDNWIEYFQSNLEKNYQRNITMLNSIPNSNVNLNASNEAIGKDFCFLSSSIYSNSLLDTSAIAAARRNSIDKCNAMNDNLLDSDDILDNVNQNNTNSLENSFNYLLNNCTVNMRINFYQILVEKFKKFPTNKYKENLYYTQLFIEIFSLPYIFNKGVTGEHFYNIYANVTYACKKKFVIFTIGSVGIFHHITTKLDEIVKLNFSKDEIDRIIATRILEREGQIQLFPRNSKKKVTGGVNEISPSKLSEYTKNIEFWDNLILFIEVYKEYVSNIITKCHLDQINYTYSKRVLNCNIINPEI